MSILDDLAFDDNGYMLDQTAWTEEIAQALADRDQFTLSEKHWEVIRFTRAWFFENGSPPTIRNVTRHLNMPTIELFQLFPGFPVKLAAKYAGLSEPAHCI